MESMKTISGLAGKFEKLLERLPGAIQKPVQREWRPLKELFIQKRAPRVLLIGFTSEAFFRSLFQASLGKIEGSNRLWQTLRNRGVIQFAVADEQGTAARGAIASIAPDLILFVTGEGGMPGDLALLAELHRFDMDRHEQPAPIIAVGVQPSTLTNALHGDNSLSPSVAAVLPLAGGEAILAAMASALPQEARLEFARVSGEKVVQREIATTLTRSATGVCAAIGAQPIPLADFPILTSIQLLLIAGIVHTTGRDWNLATARAFLAAIGANIGTGLVLREGARAVVKLLPGWGNAISGAIAGAGTYAIGRAAMGYFIDGVPMEEARRRFRLLKRGKKPKTPH